MSRWYETPSTDYIVALSSVHIAYETDAGQFFAHAEDGSEFRSANGRIHQLGWHLCNTRMEETFGLLNKSLGLPKSYITLDGFEGGHGCFLDRADSSVLLLALGATDSVMRWGDFSFYLSWYFGTDSRRRLRRRPEGWPFAPFDGGTPDVGLPHASIERRGWL